MYWVSAGFQHLLLKAELAIEGSDRHGRKRLPFSSDWKHQWWDLIPHNCSNILDTNQGNR
jgi:hypothetical protein